MTEIFDLNEEKRGSFLLLRMKGKLDAISSPSTEKRIFEHINQGSLNIVLNFSEIEYLSSAGLRMLLTINKTLTPKNGKLYLTHITPHVKDVLKMSGFDQMLTLYSTDEEVLATQV